MANACVVQKLSHYCKSKMLFCCVYVSCNWLPFAFLETDLCSELEGKRVCWFLVVDDRCLCVLLAATIMLSCCSQKASFDNLLSRAWLILVSMCFFHAVPSVEEGKPGYVSYANVGEAPAPVLQPIGSVP